MSVDEDYMQQVMRTLSHDVSGALRAAIGFSKLIRQQYEEKLDDKALGWLNLMEQEGECAQEKLKAFSRYARLYGIDEQLGECDLGAICTQAANECSQQSPHFVFEVEALPTIEGHKKLWLAYFQELLANAACYAGDKAVCRAYEGERGGDSCIIIEDNGIGLDERSLDIALQPFKSLHEGEGKIGMGLPT